MQNVINWTIRIWKKRSLFNLVSHQPEIDKIYLYAKGSCETKHQLIINEKKYSLKNLNVSKAFIEGLNDINDTCVK